MEAGFWIDQTFPSAWHPGDTSFPTTSAVSYHQIPGLSLVTQGPRNSLSLALPRTPPASPGDFSSTQNRLRPRVGRLDTLGTALINKDEPEDKQPGRRTALRPALSQGSPQWDPAPAVWKSKLWTPGIFSASLPHSATYGP